MVCPMGWVSCGFRGVLGSLGDGFLASGTYVWESRGSLEKASDWGKRGKRNGLTAFRNWSDVHERECCFTFEELEAEEPL